MKTELIGFRTTEQQRQKLEALAIGEGVSMSQIITRLIDSVSVVSVHPVIKPGLKFAHNDKSAEQSLSGRGAFVGNN